MSAHEGFEVPDVILEQYRLNELPHAEADRVDHLLRRSETLQRRLEALDRSDADLARQHPPAWMAERVRGRIARAAPGGRPHVGPARRWAVPAVLGVAAIALAVALPRLATAPDVSGPPAADGTDRIKGLRPALAVYRRTSSGTETLADGDVARKGDLLRLGYTAAGHSHGVIVSIDGNGAVTLHLPPRGDRAAPLGGGGTVLLDEAYELDDAPGWERFFFVTSEVPFDVAPIVAAARRAAAADLRSPPASLAIPRELSQSMFSLQKEVRP